MLKNAVRLFITANTAKERKAWMATLEQVLQGATITAGRGVYLGKGEPVIILEHTEFCDGFEFLGKVSSILDEVERYQVACQQHSALVEVCLGGIWYTSPYMEKTEHYTRFYNGLVGALRAIANSR